MRAVVWLRLLQRVSHRGHPVQRNYAQAVEQEEDHEQHAYQQNVER